MDDQQELTVFDPSRLEDYSMDDLTEGEERGLRRNLAYGDCALPAPIVGFDPGDEIEEAA